MARIKRRNPIAALVLSLLVPGLGQMYNGQLARGMSLLAALVLAAIINRNSGLATTFHGFCLGILIGFALQLSVAVDALLGARRLKEIPLKRYNRWYYYACVIVLVAVGIYPFFRLIYPLYTLQVKGFKMPSASMEPTLRLGDRFMTRVKFYSSQKPARNDVVVFLYPKDPSKKFIKRIVGMEGDKVEIRDRRLFVNDKPVEEPWVVHGSSYPMPKDKSPRDNYGPTVIPSGCVFVLGDNRDHSLDSRFWGFVQCNKIVGKALYIYWSDDRRRIGLDLK